VSRVRLLVAGVLLLIAAPAIADAQVFLASKPNPPFEIGPLFVRASVTPSLGALDVNVIWSVVLPAARSGSDSGQDLYLMWPSALVPDPKIGKGDPALDKYIADRGFNVTASGRLTLTAQNLYRSGADRAEPISGGAPFVTFVREDSGPLGGTTPASFIRIPWDPRALNRAYLMRLSMKAQGMIRPKPATWLVVQRGEAARSLPALSRAPRPRRASERGPRAAADRLRRKRPAQDRRAGPRVGESAAQ
jgi:hypothetical protein